MAIPAPVVEFLDGKRFAVAGVSRDTRQTAKAILMDFGTMRPGRARGT